MVDVHFLKMLTDFISYTVVKSQHFQSTLLGGREGVTNKSSLCTLLIMFAILDDPLNILLDWFTDYRGRQGNRVGSRYRCNHIRREAPAEHGRRRARDDAATTAPPEGVVGHYSRGRHFVSEATGHERATVDVVQGQRGPARVVVDRRGWSTRRSRFIARNTR